MSVWGQKQQGLGLRGCAGGYSQGGCRPQPTASAVPAAQPSSRCRCDAAKAGTRAVACSACAAGPTPLPRHLTAVLGCQQPMAPGPGAEVSAGSGLPRFLHWDAGPKNSSWWWWRGGERAAGLAVNELTGLRSVFLAKFAPLLSTFPSSSADSPRRYRGTCFPLDL